MYGMCLFSITVFFSSHPSPMSLASIAFHALSLLLLPGATLLLLFCVLSGGVHSFPFNTFYWVQADTSSLGIGHDVSRWTFWGICNPARYSDSKEGICSSLGPAVPISPVDNFNVTDISVFPHDFVDNEQSYYYLSRFAFAALIVALVLCGVCMINSLFAVVKKQFKEVNVLYIFLAMIFAILGASCGTAVSVMVRNDFNHAGLDAKLNSAFFGMVWAAVFILIVMFFMTCCGAAVAFYKKETGKNSEQYESPYGDYEKIQQQQTNEAGAQQPLQPAQSEEHPESSGIKFFKIKRNSQNEAEEA